ncbi:MAG: Gfo/Idh/MocA family oxidoreductase [Chitinophagaceae bacterium]|nr:Gfo/Idh/MocA family oxidoreductase [Chitinophagaceae bacterium]
MKNYHRRDFIKTSVTAGIGLSLTGTVSSLFAGSLPAAGKRVGIIGLDTSHSVEFTKVLNSEAGASIYNGYRVVAAYPKGSPDIESSVSRVPGYIEKVQGMGVEIVESIDDLLRKVDVVLLETNDGRVHLEQAIPVLKAGKTVFIDKPVTASLADAIIVFEIAKHLNVPVFSSSSLRFMSTAQDVAKGKIGKVLGADTYTPSVIEKTHPDFFWYGIHGVEMLYTVMGTGCKEVVRIHSEGTDIAVGRWADGRIGTFRGTRTGKHLYGGTAYGENGNTVLGPFDGYEGLLKQIVLFFETGNPPVQAEETLELITFMEAADESKKRKGAPVALEQVRQKARKDAMRRLKTIAADNGIRI